MVSSRKGKRQYRSEARRAPAVHGAAKKLGVRIRELRIESSLTQEKLAERARLDVKHLQAIEAGTTNVTLASLLGLSRALRVRLAELFDGM